MSHSKVSICNIALAALGAASIRDFDESNKRARMCDVFYDFARGLILSKFDWPFARAYAELQQVDMTDEDEPDNTYTYQLPVDCKTPRTIKQLGSKDQWRVVGNTLQCALDDDLFLYYTRNVTDPALFSDTFVDLLYMKLAVQMGPSLTSDKKVIQLLSETYRLTQQESWESDANQGNDYRSYDENPDNDTFVNPDGVEYNGPNIWRTSE